MNVVAIEAALSLWAETVVPTRPTHWYDQNATAPVGPYTSLRFESIDQFGRTEVQYEDQEPVDGEDVWEDVRADVHLIVQVDLYRGPVAADMALLRVSPQRYDDQLLLQAGGLGFISATEALDLAEVIHEGVGWEDRLQSDFTFFTSYEFRRELITINRVSITNASTGYVIEVDPV